MKRGRRASFSLFSVLVFTFSGSQEFTIKGDNTSISTSLDFQIEVDGRLMDALVVEPQTSSMSRGAPVSSTSVRPFTFFRLDVTDGEVKRLLSHNMCVDVIA